MHPNFSLSLHVISLSLVPVFKVVNALASEVEATVDWLLESNGILPLVRYTLTLTAGPGPEGIVSNITTDLEGEAVPDGTTFNTTFRNLQPGSMYSLQISGSNSMHTAIPLFFAIETDAGKFAVSIA